MDEDKGAERTEREAAFGEGVQTAETPKRVSAREPTSDDATSIASGSISSRRKWRLPDSARVTEAIIAGVVVAVLAGAVTLTIKTYTTATTVDRVSREADDRESRLKSLERSFQGYEGLNELTEKQQRTIVHMCLLYKQAQELWFEACTVGGGEPVGDLSCVKRGEDRSNNSPSTTSNSPQYPSLPPDLLIHCK